jgi:hypothetical protein
MRSPGDHAFLAARRALPTSRPPQGKPASARSPSKGGDSSAQALTIFIHDRALKAQSDGYVEGRRTRPLIPIRFAHRSGCNRTAAHGCVNGVPASQRALAGRPSVEVHPLPLGDWIGVDPVGVTQGQG